MTDAIIMQLPSPPRKNVFREWSGGMGTALESSRESWGHDSGYYDIPYSAYLYIARRLQEVGVPFGYFDLQSRESMALADFDAIFAEEQPAVLITQVNLPSLEHDLELVRRARKICPVLKVILLGATAKWFAERMLREGHADVVMTDAEELLVSDNVVALIAEEPEKLQGCKIRRDDMIVSMPTLTPMKDLNFIDFPAYELLDFSRYESDFYSRDGKVRYATVFTTKGCPYKCGYCPYPFGFGRRLIYRSPERVGNDIERLNREFGVQQILFRDQVFTINPNHTRAVCQELIRRNLGISWVCETRYDLVDEDMLDLMARSGCTEVHFGLESADEEMFASIAKVDGPKSLDLFEKVIGMTKARGLRAHVHLIVGMPDESKASVRNTSTWLRRVKPDSVQVAYFMPYPGTPLYAELDATGELGDVRNIDWEAMGAFSGPVLPSRHLSPDQIKTARHRILVDWQYTLSGRIKNKVRKLTGITSQRAAMRP